MLVVMLDNVRDGQLTVSGERHDIGEALDKREVGFWFWSD